MIDFCWDKQVYQPVKGVEEYKIVPCGVWVLKQRGMKFWVKISQQKCM